MPFLTMRALAVLLLLTIATAATASPSNKWRLEFSGASHSAGEIVIEINPIGGEPLTVHISVSDDTGENAVAKRVVEVLREELPDDVYHIERDDGEDVLIKKRHGAANFDLQVIFNSVKHVRVNVDRE